ncbi:MAG TPA: glycosyltransferase, partial [Chloroflexota bacterium]
WYLLGAARTQLGNHREALAAYERAVSLRPDVSDFHNGLGTALCFLMDEASLVRAFSCFQRATQLDPANARAWVNVIELALRVAQLDVAEQALGRARELLPDDEQLAWLAFDIANARAIEHAPVPYRPAPPELDSLRRRPRISVLVPIHNVPLQYFQELLVCLEQQRYPEWELCAIDDASTDEQLRNALSDAAGRDPRIRIEFLPESLNISGATNVALEMASGEYVAFLDHDDLLDPDALLYVAGALDEDPQPDVIYSDEDKLTLDGRYAEPYTKADWSPELLLSNMYMAHLLVMRKALVEEVGGLRSAFNGAQDFDLALRVTERANRIRHLPVMLYHWRKIPGSTADDISSKPYAADAGARAVAEAMSRRGLSGSLEHGYQPCTYRPRINIPACRVSAIILSPGRPEALQRCISSLHASAGGRDLEIVLASQDGEPFNYSRWNNLAVQKATGDVLLFLNDDIEAADAGWLDALLEFAFFPGVGAVGSRLLYPGAERRVEHAGIGLGLGGVAGKLHRGLPENWLTVLGPMRIANYSAVSGACMMLRREAFERVGGFDEAFANHFGDVDLCLRLWQAGLRVVYTPFAALLHHATLPWEEETSEDSPEAALMVERWATWLANDPFLNPAIPRVCEEFSRWQAMYWPGTALRMLETRRQVAHAV